MNRTHANDVPFRQSPRVTTRTTTPARPLPPWALLLHAAALLMAGSNAYAAAYDYTDLGAMAGTSSRAFGINAAGQVVGDSNLSGTTRGTLWIGATPSTLFSVGTSYATAINDNGQVAGFGDGRAILWSGTIPTYLGASGETSVAYGVNDAGQVAGHSYSGSDWHATRWTVSTTTDLGTLGGSNSFAAGINGSGQVVGWSQTTGNLGNRAVRWDADNPVELGPLGVKDSYGLAINAAGTVAGFSGTAAGDTVHATVWHGVSPLDLGTLGGSDSWAYGINGSGTVVGKSFTTANTAVHATVWDGAVPIDLNGLLEPDALGSGWYLYEAFGINDSGWIVGTARNSITGADHAFLLSPVPEPASYLLAFAGLAVLGGVMRRRERNFLPSPETQGGQAGPR